MVYFIAESTKKERETMEEINVEEGQNTENDSTLSTQDVPIYQQPAIKDSRLARVCFGFIPSFICFYCWLLNDS